MSLKIIKIEIRYEHDIVLARQRARAVAELLGFDINDQTRISTAVSEIARNAYKYAGGGYISFLIEGGSKPQIFIAQINDRGPGIENMSAVLNGGIRSKTGMGLGLSGARRLMDHFHIESEPGKGSKVMLGKIIPQGAPLIDERSVAGIADALLRQSPNDPIEELQQQNQELLRTMSELKELTDKLASANLKLRELDRLKSMFIASMSHELRTPLNSILGFTGIILMGMSGEISAIQRKQLGMVKNSANHLLDLINDVIDVSKIEAGKTDLFIEDFSLSELISEVKESFSVAAAEKCLRLDLSMKDGLAVISDRRRVRQILVNLVGNAIKFTETGSVAILVEEKESGFDIKVRDTGVGMEKEDMDKLFDAFSRIHIHGRPMVEGTGLGLYLSRRIAALLGGGITAQSEAGSGSEFTLYLPRQYQGEKT
jgi:signal transduction histidine kinase